MKVCSISLVVGAGADKWKNFIELNKQFFKDNPGVKPATKA